MLVFIHVSTRRIIVSPSTINPGRDWMMEQTERFIEHATHMDRPPGILIHDGDKKFCAEFRLALRRAQVYDKPIRYRTPNMNAHVERAIKTLKHECLDRFIVLGTDHLDHLTGEFTRHYNLERPHSAIGMRTPYGGPAPVAPWTVPREGPALAIVCKERLGGLLRHYVRVAA